MKLFRFADIVVRVDQEEGLQELALPKAMVHLDEVGPGEPHIHVNMSVGSLEVEVPDSRARMVRGGMEAFGDQEHLLWVHHELGPLIDVYPRAGKVEIQLPSWAWAKTTDMFDQLMLPALLPVFAARGLRAFHASAVSINGTGVLFAGPSGSGKTTSALLLISHGAKLIADDLLFLYRENGMPVMCGLGDGIRAHEDVWERFPHLRPGPAEPSGKRRLNLDEVPWQRSVKAKAAVLLGGLDEQQQMPAAKAIPRLLSLCYHAGDEEVAVRTLAEMTQHMMIYSAEGAEGAATIALQPGTS